MGQLINSICSIRNGEGPVVAAAIHNGHAVRDEVREHLAISAAERLREEDPFTGAWTAIGHSQIVGLRSRFEVDLNRPRDQAVYVRPQDAWGLDIWTASPPPKLVDRSLQEYDAFYADVRRLFEAKRRSGPFVVFDLHAYNHRRAGPEQAPDDPELNPDVNVGTGTIDRKRWGPVVDRFIEVMRSVSIRGRQLDVRENIKFKGGYFSEWVHTNFGETACALAIEFKKIFMDEWTGVPDRESIAAIRDALETTVEPVLDALYEVA